MSNKSKEEKAATQIIDILSEQVNLYITDEERLAQALAKALENEHRTLQQSMVRVLIAALKAYGGSSGVDDRNKAAVTYCQNLPDGFLQYI